MKRILSLFLALIFSCNIVAAQQVSGGISKDYELDYAAHLETILKKKFGETTFTIFFVVIPIFRSMSFTASFALGTDIPGIT